VTTDEQVSLAALPMPLRWLSPPSDWSSDGAATLSVAARPQTDWFVDPRGSVGAVRNAPAAVGAPTGAYTLSARVGVDFAASFDAGALVVHASEHTWAKLCFEYSPERQPMVVSVVTTGVSDDCNSFVVDGSYVSLRIARIPPAFAFHASTDGSYWQFVRHFALEAADEPAVGFLAQSPRGTGCSVVFEEIRYAADELRDLRSGV
jgi:regulation of enolase protein 1 (concanavalin A-like superfamily)